MKHLSCIPAIIGLLLAIPPTSLQAAAAATTRPAAANERAGGPDEQIVPEVDVQADTTLKQFVTQLGATWKDVQILQFGGPWQDLRLPSLHLRNVTRKQILVLMGDLFPELEIHSLDGNLAFGDQYAGDVLVFQQRPGSQIPIRTRMTAFGLAQTVDRLVFHKDMIALLPREEPARPGQPQPPLPAEVRAANEAAEKQALSDVLSLIQATLEQCSEPDVVPSVKLHEPTETVLVKGTPAQIDAVAHTLQALNASITQDSIEAKLSRAIDDNNWLRDQLRIARNRALEAEAKSRNSPAAGKSDKKD